MRKTANNAKVIFMGAAGGDASERLIDKTRGKSSAFKAVSRGDINRLLTAKFDSNDFNRYNVKYQDKVKGTINFSPSKARPRDAKPHEHCQRGLHKLAEIALNLR